MIFCSKSYVDFARFFCHIASHKVFRRERSSVIYSLGIVVDRTEKGGKQIKIKFRGKKVPSDARSCFSKSLSLVFRRLRGCSRDSTQKSNDKFRSAHKLTIPTGGAIRTGGRDYTPDTGVRWYHRELSIEAEGSILNVKISRYVQCLKK